LFSDGFNSLFSDKNFSFFRLAKKNVVKSVSARLCGGRVTSSREQQQRTRTKQQQTEKKKKDGWNKLKVALRCRLRELFVEQMLPLGENGLRI